MVRILIFILLANFIIAKPAQAAEKTVAAPPGMPEQNEAPPEEAFDSLLEKLRRHPEIQAYVLRAEASRHNAEGELGLPDPMVFIQEQDYPIGTSMSRDREQKMLGLKQSIPAFGARGAKYGRLDIDSHRNRLLGDYAYAAMKSQLITALANLARIKERINY